MAIDRVRAADINDFISGKIANYALTENYESTKVFYFGQVINNVDPLNSNRIQIRIPGIDNSLYLNKKTDGDNKLPWCAPISRNFISTPENNSIVLVALFDPKNTSIGRIYFDAIPGLSSKDIFDKSRLVPETDTYNNWNNCEVNQNFRFGMKPSPINSYNTSENIKYPIGIRGKGNNRVFLDKTSVSIYQNEGTSTQSLLKLTDSVVLHSAKTIDIISDAGTKTFYHPVFDQPLYKYLNEVNTVIRAIITVLGTNAAITTYPTVPTLPSPSALNLANNLSTLLLKYNDFIQPANGASNQISIN